MPTPVHEVFMERLSELLQGKLSGLIRWSDGMFKLSSNTTRFLQRGQITTVPNLALKFQSLNPSTEWQELFIVEVSHSQLLGDVTQKVKKYSQELPHLVSILVVKFYESHKYAKPQYRYAEPINMQYWYNLQKDNNIKYGPLRTADGVTWAAYIQRVVPNIDVGQLYPTQAQKDEFNDVFNCVITRSILEMENIMRSTPQTVASLEAKIAAAQIAALEVATQDLIANCTGCPPQSDIFRIIIMPPEAVLRQLGEGVFFTPKKKWVGLFDRNWVFKEKNGTCTNRTCPACGKLLKTLQGVMADLSISAMCAWYRQGKGRELEADNRALNK
ncbi:hypothetical protein SERLA73DRAFT_148840 [Serpula lacrymans var. lacrymans S7.3]|uniref:Uncharacterized protein n=1 Tax=Serpula lacrymans var. lacrymans (strain S7.3) TaxID=936435 RepID=F8PFP8_SERL3|nr:hypothetical protein SERLA73DRAFT_148840 [Serpula lacrymans var. lacrymans S7.3]